MGYVSDVELKNLYSNCHLFIFPSFHEGFGLPVLEAMTCGAAVIGSNTTSIPEVINNKNALFNPYDTNEITNLILKCLQDQEFYNSLKIHSVKNAKIFSWNKTAKLAIDAFNSILTEDQNLITECSNNQFTKSERLEKKRDKIYAEIIYLIRNKNVKYQKKYLMYISACIDLIQQQARNCDHKINLTKSNFNWLIEGPYDSNYSLSILNREFAMALDKNHSGVYLNSSEGSGDYLPNISFLEKYQSLNAIHKKVRSQDISNLVVSRNLYPPRVSDIHGDLNLLHSYGWEESEYPFDWIDQFNYYLDGLTVMSNYVKKTLIDNGLSIPITVTQLGVDHMQNIYHNSNLKINAKKFKFLHVSSCFPRKGVYQLIKSYGENFTINDDVSLIIKTFVNPHNDLHNILDSAIADNPNYPHVLIIDHDISDIDMQKLYLVSNVLLSPSCGEGFGLPIAEAMLLELPVITTGFGGQLDFCNKNNSWLIDYEFKYSKSHFGLFDSIWAEPSVSHLGLLMKNLYNLSSEEIEKKTKIAKKTIEQFTWDNVAKENILFAKNIHTYKSSPPRIAFITTWNSKCGVGSYSKNLIDNMTEKILILAPNEENIISSDSDNVIRCWDKDENLEGVLSPIEKNKVTTVIIQFNYGLYDFKALNIVIDKLSLQRVNIIIIFHSTTNPINRHDKKLSSLKSSFSKCVRLLAHTPNDINTLKDLGLVKNVSLFPHGILDFEANKSSANNVLKRGGKKYYRLSTFGFCLPNKGFINLVNAIELIHKAGFKVSLYIYTSLYDSSISTEYYEKLSDTISESFISDYIILNNIYIEEEEQLLNELSKADLLVYPYEDSNESSSASVRHGLATSKPVAVTQSSIFDDVRTCVYTLPGSTSELIAQGILDFLEKKLFDKYSTSDLVLSWKKAHKFSKLGRRLLGMIKGIEVNNRSTIC